MKRGSPSIVYRTVPHRHAPLIIGNPFFGDTNNVGSLAQPAGASPRHGRVRRQFALSHGRYRQYFHHLDTLARKDGEVRVIQEQSRRGFLIDGRTFLVYGRFKMLAVTMRCRNVKTFGSSGSTVTCSQ